MLPKEMCSLIATSLRSIADLVDSLGDFVAMLDANCPVEVITEADMKNEYSDTLAVEYLTNLATADKGIKKSQVKTLINKYGFRKISAIMGADQNTIKQMMKEAEVIASATE